MMTARLQERSEASSQSGIILRGGVESGLAEKQAPFER